MSNVYIERTTITTYAASFKTANIAVVSQFSIENADKNLTCFYITNTEKITGNTKNKMKQGI